MKKQVQILERDRVGGLSWRNIEFNNEGPYKTEKSIKDVQAFLDYWGINYSDIRLVYRTNEGDEITHGYNSIIHVETTKERLEHKATFFLMGNRLCLSIQSENIQGLKPAFNIK